MSSARQGSRADRSRPDAAVSQTRACWGDEGTRFLPEGDAATAEDASLARAPLASATPRPPGIR